MKMRGARILLESLRCENVKHVFGYPGGAVLHTYDELAKSEQALGINHYLVRHEQGALFAAAGYAQATGQINGIVTDTSGGVLPGVVIEAISDATGASRTALSGTDGLYTIPLIKQYIAEGNNPDQPGRLIQWLYPRTPVYTWRVPGLWYDIGSKETLEEANKIFAKQ